MERMRLFGGLHARRAACATVLAALLTCLTSVVTAPDPTPIPGTPNQVETGSNAGQPNIPSPDASSKWAPPPGGFYRGNKVALPSGQFAYLTGWYLSLLKLIPVLLLFLYW